MNVHQLISELETWPQNAEVITLMPEWADFMIDGFNSVEVEGVVGAGHATHSCLDVHIGVNVGDNDWLGVNITYPHERPEDRDLEIHRSEE